VDTDRERHPGAPRLDAAFATETAAVHGIENIVEAGTSRFVARSRG
jgi:hypothetical protein